MNIFRSGDHIDRWVAGRSPGETMTVGKLCDLAHAWWGDRLASTWQPHTTPHNQGILEHLGLTSEFWRLA